MICRVFHTLRSFNAHNPTFRGRFTWGYKYVVRFADSRIARLAGLTLSFVSPSFNTFDCHSALADVIQSYIELDLRLLSNNKTVL